MFYIELAHNFKLNFYCFFYLLLSCKICSAFGENIKFRANFCTHLIVISKIILKLSLNILEIWVKNVIL